MNFLGLQIIKCCFLLLASAITFAALASDYSVDRAIGKRGQVLIRVINHTSEPMLCILSAVNYYEDFYVKPNTSSRWYVEPVQPYSLTCN